MSGTGSNNLNFIIAAFGTTAFIAPISYETPSGIATPNSVVEYKLMDDYRWPDNYQHIIKTEDESIVAIKVFSETLINNTKDIDPDILDVVNKNFWDLL